MNYLEIKSSLALIIGLLLVIQDIKVFGQTPYLEVSFVVEDTIQSKYQSMDLNIIMVDQSDILGFDKKNYINKEELLKFFDEHLLNYIVEENEINVIDYSARTVNINTTINDPETISLVLDFCVSYNNLEMNINTATIPNEEEYRQRLLEKIIEKGEKRIKIYQKVVGAKDYNFLRLEEEADGFQDIADNVFSYNLNKTIGWTAYPPNSIQNQLNKKDGYVICIVPMQLKLFYVIKN